jgi:hypothetical protein
MSVANEALKTARLWQPLACLGLLASIALSALAVESVIHNDAFGARMDYQWSKVNESFNEYKRQYLDTEDRIVLQELSDLDAQEGGVYFFGASNMKWSMRVPDLPPAERKLVHNFGAGSGSPYFNRQLTEFLVEHKDLLRAGPKKTLVVYGTGFLNVKPPADGPAAVFPNLWRRYGLYRYDFERGIEPVSRGALWDACFLEKARCSSFIQGLINKAGPMAVPRNLRRRQTVRDPAAYEADYTRRIGPSWEDDNRQHGRKLQEWFDYVHGQGMNFAVVLLPLASWHGPPLPYPPEISSGYRGILHEEQ